MENFSKKQKQYFKLPQRPPLTLGYIRVSPDRQVETDRPLTEESLIREQGYDVFAVLYETESGKTAWRKRTRLKWLIDGLKKGDRLLVSGFSHLGRSITDVLTILSLLHQRGIIILDVKNQWLIDARVSGKTLEMLGKISAQVDHEVVSTRVTEGLAARRAKGLPLGRKKGATVKSKLDAHKKEIISLLKAGSTKAYIMKKFNTSKTNLYHWLKRNSLETIGPEFSGDNKTP